MKTLKFASCMAENTEALCQGVAEYTKLKLEISTEYVTGIPWQERERLFDQGEIQVLWLCGLPYVHKADLVENSMELLAVPIPTGERYRARPVYFSDVGVRRNGPFRSFFDLRGAPWAYNEPRSHSSFNVVRAYLSQLGEKSGFFSAIFESGSHSASIEMILSRIVDGAAIDSTVLEWNAAQGAGLMDEIRVIETIGPSPIPPWVISRRVPRVLRARLRELLIGMEQDPEGRVILERGRIARFVLAHDRDYDPIRRMATQAEQVSLA
jgi:ABC-type phosphate/phosphonate transport system substrate-binding protein